MISTLPRTLISLLFAVLFSQAPEFFQQYTQRVGGIVSEQYSNIANLEGIAQRNPDGELAAYRDQLVHTYTKTKTHYDSMIASSAFSRPMEFFGAMNQPAAKATWEIYKPAVPTTTEGAMYALAGFFAGSFFFSMFLWLFSARREKDADGVL